MKRFILYFWITLFSLCSSAAEVGDSLEVYLLTCSPGTEIYSLYGHTALEVYNKTLHRKVVFNYGVFDFTRPNFGWHFAMGETDYFVMPCDYYQFLLEYKKRGSHVVAQHLNLTWKEKNRLFEMLLVNCRPENCVYRYNYLTNNCTTRVRDIIERCIDGDVVYNEMKERVTYRQIMHRYTVNSAWAELGNDILLGANVDTILSTRAAMFVPENLQGAFAKARIHSESMDTRPMVLDTEVVQGEGRQIDHPGFPFTPVQCAVALFAVCLIILGLESFFSHQMWGVDVLLMSVQGLLGCVLCFLFTYSEHPTLDSNFQIWLLNPLPLLGIYFVVKAARRKERTIWHGLNFMCLFLFVLFIPWVPQDYSAGIFPLALALMTRPISYFLAYRKL